VTNMNNQISVVLGTYNRLRFLKLTIDSIREELAGSSFSHEIIVVDGGSTDGTLPWLLKQKDIITVVQHNRGDWRGMPIERRSWGYFINLGFKCAQGKYICMLSDDCLVVPGAIKNGVELFEARQAAGEKVGAVAFYWRDWPLEKEYRVGFTYGNRLHINHGLYLRQAMVEINFAEENKYKFYHADSDMSLRLWDSGYICIASETSFIEHYSHANLAVRKTNHSTQKEDWNNYVCRWNHMPGPDQDWNFIKHNDEYQTVNKFRESKNWDCVIKRVISILGFVKSVCTCHSEVTIISPNDHNLISDLKRKFTHNRRQFVHGTKKYLADCLYCHAVPGTLESCLVKIYALLKCNKWITNILNLGGGVGQVSEILSELNLHVSNLDVAIESNYVNKDNINYDLNSNNILSFGNKKFGMILCQEVIEHLENPWLLFKHIANVIENNGYLILTMPNIQSKYSKKLFNNSGYYHWFNKEHLSYHVNPIPLWELVLIANKNKFKILEIIGNGEYYLGRSSEKTIEENECLIIVMRFECADK
jgi:glycosyltransferase involved in cell wall biosynthesis